MAEDTGALRAVIVRLWPDALVVVTITLAVGLTSQRWAGLDTPDSSFYTTLALFGSEVTDRAIENSYFWTRLGQILPNMALTTALGPWVGFAAFRMIMLLAVVAGAYVVVRRFGSRPMAATGALLVATSTVVLSYLGNPYLTGSVLGRMSVLTALALFRGRVAAVLSGFVLGWLALSNPGGFLLAAFIWLAVRLLERTRVVEDLVVAAATATATAIALIGLGRLAFPDLNWWQSTVEAAGTRLTDFSSDSPVWLQDISLLVPLGITVVVTVTWLLNRTSAPARLAATIALASIVGMVGVNWVMGGIALEAPMYQAMLWPPALIALTLALVAATQGAIWTKSATATAVVGVAAVWLAGHWPGALGLAAGWALLAVVVALAITGLVVARRRASVAVAVAGVVLLLVGAQLLQNSRGPIGLYYLSPYNWAYNANPIGSKLHTAVEAEQWLLARTTHDDRITNWVGADWVSGDRELYVVAGMQLWGPNIATLAPTLSPDDAARLSSLKPTVINMVAPSMEQVIAFWSSIPGEARPTAPQCYDFTWPVAPGVGHACLTHLTWSAP